MLTTVGKEETRGGIYALRKCSRPTNVGRRPVSFNINEEIHAVRESSK